MERVIVFLLSQIMERPSLFSLHPPKESCKVLWKDNQAVGFYTVKHKGGQRRMGVIGKQDISEHTHLQVAIYILCMSSRSLDKCEESCKVKGGRLA